jgi:hypothetical protein
MNKVRLSVALLHYFMKSWLARAAYNAIHLAGYQGTESGNNMASELDYHPFPISPFHHFTISRWHRLITAGAI